ncbi:MAG: pilus assembly protein N-terminal domain-containing protein [Bryobacteraceae bacterium]
MIPRYIRGAAAFLALVASCTGLLTAGDSPSTSLVVSAGKSLVIDTPSDLRRVAVANGDLAEALAVNPREVLINGKAAGATTVVLWLQDGARTLYDLRIRANEDRLNAARQELERELAGQDVGLELDSDTVFLRGTVRDLAAATRATSIAATLGKVVNLLRVEVPAADAQILLKVRFADVDRAASTELGANLLSTGATNTIGQVTTGQFSPATPNIQDRAVQWTLSEALNVFLFRPDLNLGIVIKALQNKNLLEMLAEPNVLAIDGQPASFVAGGEFPFPVVQGGTSSGAVTIQFREYGVRINFLPTLTPRGSIRLQVAPEVSSLDFAHALQFQGYTIPALATRRVQTEVELESGQSFVIAGLLDNSVTESFNKIPGIGDIPILGKLFHSRSVNRNNTELMVLVTPELVRPIPVGTAAPGLRMSEHFLELGKEAPRTPGAAVTGPVFAPEPKRTIPLEQLEERGKAKQAPQLLAPASSSPQSAMSAGGIK